MSETRMLSPESVVKDFTAGVVVFFVALPLCLGIALASGVPPLAGLLTGIIGGIVVGMLSGSHTSVSGPAAGLTAIVAVQVTTLPSFNAFLLAVVLAGVIQIVLGIARAGSLSAFFPNSVVQGLLAAIGIILILKQMPHLLGHDAVPEGEFAYLQSDDENTLTELYIMVSNLHPGAAVIGLTSLAILMVWGKLSVLRNSVIPAPLVVVLVGLGLRWLMNLVGGEWAVNGSHVVQVPIFENIQEALGFLQTPDFAQWKNPAIYTAGLTIAIVASLETLLNLEATDKLDRKQRSSPPSRELWAQGIGNVMAGMVGGIPMTAVIVRGSVNIHAGSQTRLSTIVHGCLLLVFVMFFPRVLNQIPLSCLAAILLHTGMKLASPTLMRRMWNDGRYQFLPFIITVLAIVLTDLMIGVGIGMVVSIGFILSSNLRRPVQGIVERHLGKDVLRVDLANQVSFLNRAAFDRMFNSLPPNGHLLLNAENTEYLDPDILSMIREFKEKTAPVRGIRVSLQGFQNKYNLQDDIQYQVSCNEELQKELTPGQVLRILKDGNERFRSGRRLSRDHGQQLKATATGQHPLAVVLSCIDSRTPSEMILDLGLGDIFSIRIAGNIVSGKVLGSIEYGCAVAGAKLIVVIGHTRCGAVTAAIDLAASGRNAEQATGCQNLKTIVRDIEQAFDDETIRRFTQATPPDRIILTDEVAQRNVLRTLERIREESTALSRLLDTGSVGLVGAMYDVATGYVRFLSDIDEGNPAVFAPVTDDTNGTTDN